MKIKAIIATNTFVTLVPEAGDPITFTGSNLISTQDLITMSQNIAKDGYTEIITGNQTFKNMFETWVKSLNMANIEMTQLIPHAIAQTEENTEANLDETGLGIFMKRLKASAYNDSQKVQAIVDFISRSDLVVTDDGNILAYRRVYQDSQGNLLDNHTQSIPQDLYTTVAMERSQVDDNGNISCSRGLHIASSSYVKSFSGTVLQLVLVEPENIISVPYNDRTKMRVCEYDIIYQFSDAQFKTFMEKGSEGIESVISHFVSGNRPEIDKKIFLTGSKTYEVLESGKKSAVVGNKSKKKAVVDLKKELENTPMVDTKKVKQSLNLIPLVALFEAASSYTDKKSRYNDLLVYKRKQKKSWEKLGLSAEQIKAINNFGGKI